MGALAVALVGLPGLAGAAGRSTGADYPIRPVPFTAVVIDDAFWSPRMETNRTVTLRHDFDKCETTRRVANFEVAGGLAPGAFVGGYGFNDSDVYKVIEGASYSLKLRPDPELERTLDEIIAKIAAAQEQDGYLYTAGTIGRLAEDPICCISPTRWADISRGHELYNAGHLYEAAAAHYQATGRRNLLDVALKNADLLDRVFGPGRRLDPPGHQEVEIGLVKLSRATGDPRYLELARFFLDQRGRPGHASYGPYSQDHVPVTEQKEAVGHAVRAGYMYSAMADVSALTGNDAYLPALDRLWQDVVSHKLYLTGGVGAHRGNEGFGEAWELPNRSAYAETCAAVALAMWNHRMFLLRGDSRYLDVLERVLYNGFLSGVSLDGQRFFYPNPLASDGKAKFNQGQDAVRSPWFDCSCCPTNVVRFLPSIAGFVYAARGDEIFVNLYVAGRGSVEVEGGTVGVRQETRYPWDGTVRVSVEPDRPRDLTLRLRVPGWARGKPVPSDLYRYAGESAAEATVSVNGRPAPLDLVDGFANVSRRWKAGDVVELTLPMPIRRVASHEKVAADASRVALERGPVVYCAEAVDNEGRAFNLVLPDDALLEARPRPDLLGGVTVITGRALGLHPSEDGRSVVTRAQPFTAVPYHVWAHRGEGEMVVWLPRRVQLDSEVP